jgi:hypothetical protein
MVKHDHVFCIDQHIVIRKRWIRVESVRVLRHGYEWKISSPLESFCKCAVVSSVILEKGDDFEGEYGVVEYIVLCEIKHYIAHQVVSRRFLGI